jgi:hypothetical protein
MVFDFVAFNMLCLESLLDNGEWVAAIDASFARKSGRTSYGLGWFWNGSQGQAERGLEISLLDVTHDTAYTLSAYQTPVFPKAPEVSTVPKEVRQTKLLKVTTSNIKPRPMLINA